MQPERELGRKQTALVRGATDTKMGTAIVTTERVLFFDKKYMGGAAGGALGVLVAESLQRRHEAEGPLLDLPLASVKAIERRRKMLNKDRIALITADGEHVLNEGWVALAPVLREALASAHGSQVVEQGADRLEVGP